MAEIYLKGGTEKTLILGVREAFYEKFAATNWTDIRVGFFVSITDKTADDTITGLGETITSVSGLPWTDRFSLGLTDSRSGSVFLGYTNLVTNNRPTSTGDSILLSSDGGIGTSNTNFWRVKHESSDLQNAKILDGGIVRSRGGTGEQIHFIQNTVGAGGYATLIALRFTRPDPRGQAKVITMTMKTSAAKSTDILYTNTPTSTILQTNLESFPAIVQQYGPVELSQEPDTIWAYWPFHNSRLRIHAYGLLRAASA